MNMNQLFNSIDFLSLQVLLAPEGIKSIAALWGRPIRGKAALGLFLALLFGAALETGGMPRPETYVVLTALRGLAMVGLYRLVSRLYDALNPKR